MNLNYKKIGLLLLIILGLIAFYSFFFEKKYTIIIRNEWDDKINVSVVIDGDLITDSSITSSHIQYTSVESNLKFGYHNLVCHINDTITIEEEIFVFKDQWSSLFTYESNDMKEVDLDNYYFKPIF